MKTYLLEITRGVRAERPSEDQITSDSIGADIGNVAGVQQVNTTDNFFLLSSTMDLQANVDRIISTMQFNPFAMSAGNGWRTVEYPHSDIWTKDFTQLYNDSEDLEGNPVRTYADVWVQYTQETGGGTETFKGENALADAQAFIETLGASDGWVLGQEWGKTIVIYSRPSLWHDAEYVPVRGSKVNPMLGRTESDRW